MILERLNRFLQQLFSFSNAESKGFISLMIFSMILIAILFLPDLLFNKKVETDEAEARFLDSLASILERKKDEPGIFTKFSFDPNIISEDSLVLLGVDRKIAERLNNYRKSGRSFGVKKDLKKIYGFSDQLYNKLYDLIDLPDSLAKSKLKSEKLLEINAVSIGDLEKIPQINRLMASRIVNFRTALGGFISIEQLQEVYDITTIQIANLKKRIFIGKDFRPKSIKINSAAKKVLSSHPYISHELADDIVRYRDINGKIESEKVLVNFNSVDKGNYKKLILYLDFQ